MMLKRDSNVDDFVAKTGPNTHRRDKRRANNPSEPLVFCKLTAFFPPPPNDRVLNSKAFGCFRFVVAHSSQNTKFKQNEHRRHEQQTVVCNT